ncbi:DNA N-6-adenine-methyltransferase [Falsiroseomonas sp. HW251]|uniref:DNA N-6-adenine-methyltransferase n=1 Tax=Falsiroseomonas sp. HW251 TaxID=3390998 RepID=UPI003D31E040
MTMWESMAAIRTTSLLARQLQKMRKARGLSLVALAELGGCSGNAARQAEAGRGSSSAYIRLAEAVAIKLDARSLPPGGDIGSRIGAQRQRRGMSVDELARIAKVNVDTVRKVERGNLGQLNELEAVGRALHARLTLLPVDARPTFYGSAATSSAKDDWPTPPEFLDRLTLALGRSFDLDPCSPGAEYSRVPASRHYTKVDDGLAQPWTGSAFMNPPYGSSMDLWVRKAREEVASSNALVVVGLIPARVDTRWWHDDVAGHADTWFLRGRLRFGDGDGTAPFPSAIAVWGASEEEVLAISEEWPDAFCVLATHRVARTRLARLLGPSLAHRSASAA